MVSDDRQARSHACMRYSISMKSSRGKRATMYRSSYGNTARISFGRYTEMPITLGSIGVTRHPLTWTEVDRDLAKRLGGLKCSGGFGWPQRGIDRQTGQRP